MISKSFLTSISLSTLNQIVSSGTNFAIGIFLARTLSTIDFGVYGICFAACLLWIGIGNATIFTPMSVDLPDKSTAEKEQYIAKMYRITKACSYIPIGASALLLLVHLHPSISSKYYLLASSTALLSGSLLIREYFHRVAFIQRREQIAFKSSLITALGLATSLVFLSQSEIPITSTASLILYAFSAAISAFYCKYKIAILHPKLDSQIAKEIKEAIMRSRWALAGAGITWTQTQAYAYTALFMIGAGGVGQINKAKILISAFPLIATAVSQVGIHRLAHLRINNSTKFFLAGRTLTIGLTLIGVIYISIILIGYGAIAPMILGKSLDENIWILTVAWCFSVLVQGPLNSAAIHLQALQKFKEISIANTVSAIISVALTALFCSAMGLKGAILGLVSGDLVLATLLWMVIMRQKDALSKASTKI